MSNRTTSHVAGGKALANLLKELPEQMQKKVLMRAVKKGSKVIKKEIQQRAPVGDIDIGGTKKASKKLKYSRKKDAYEVIKLRSEIKEKVIQKDHDQVKVAITAGRAYWAQFWEFGTRHMSKRPFFRPGFDVAAPRALDAMAEDVSKGLLQQIDKLNGKYKKSGLK